MRPSKAAYVTACQQILALAVVLAVLAPAAAVVSLDVVTSHPSGTPSTLPVQPSGDIARTSALVPTAPVDPTVREIALTPAAGSALVPDGRRLLRRTPTGRTEIVSRPEPVDGFGTVGVTWSSAAAVADGALDVRVRTRTGTSWSGWQSLPYDAEHGPDAGSAEAARARPGTDPVVVGTVDDVQVKAVSAAAAPADLRLAVVSPGTPEARRVETPAIDTGALDAPARTAPTEVPQSEVPQTEVPQSEVPSTDAIPSGPTNTGRATDIPAGPGSIALQAGTYTAKPVIYSRAQWGADDRMRTAGSLRYGEVHAGFVHHTVNANDYSAAEVPGIIQSIYAYHTRSRGWSDIGYNFLIDRFGRTWEGRYGGVDRPVVGAHTLGYNDDAFAASAIGNFELTSPSEAVLQAYARLFAWKLSLSGVSASSTRQLVTSRYFQAVNGHRDAGQTACPGRYLYAQIPRIRSLAAADQASWSGRQRETDLDGAGHPDLVVRERSTGAAYLVRTRGGLRLGPAVVASGSGWAATNAIVATPDVTGDRRADVVARVASTGVLTVHAGDGEGHFGVGGHPTKAFAAAQQITAVGDLDRDGRNDLFVRSHDRAYVFSGNGAGGFTPHLLSASWPYDLTVGVGDFSGDGKPDLVARDTTGRLWLVPGVGRNNAVGPRRLLATGWGSVQALTGLGDWTGDGLDDLLVRTVSGTYVFPNVAHTSLGHWLGPITSTAGLTALTSGGSAVGSAAPDLVARRGDQLVTLPHAGTYGPLPPRRLGIDLTGVRQILNVGDWDRDGDDDLVVRTTAGALNLLASNGRGAYAAPRTIAGGFDARVTMLTATGDYDGDGYPDLVGQMGGQMRVWLGRGAAGLDYGYVTYSAVAAKRQVGVGLWDADGAPDTIVGLNGTAVVYPGNGPGGLTTPRSLGLRLAPYNWVLGLGDLNGDGHADLLVRQRRSGALWLLPGTTTGFGARVFYGEGYGGFDRAG